MSWNTENSFEHTLILMVGLPQSGKTTEALKMGFPVVSPEAVRKVLGAYPFDADLEPDVWAMCREMTSALFLAGHKAVIFDATNLKVKHRKSWDKGEGRTIRYCFVDTPADVCKQRALANGKMNMLNVIDKLSADLTECCEEEEPGFDDRLLVPLDLENLRD